MTAVAVGGWDGAVAVLLGVLIPAGAVLQVLLWRRFFRERREWRAFLEGLERRHTAALCGSGAESARAKMRTRRIRRLLEEMIGRNGG